MVNGHFQQPCAWLTRLAYVCRCDVRIQFKESRSPGQDTSSMQAQLFIDTRKTSGHPPRPITPGNGFTRRFLELGCQPRAQALYSDTRGLLGGGL